MFKYQRNFGNSTYLGLSDKVTNWRKTKILRNLIYYKSETYAYFLNNFFLINFVKNWPAWATNDGRFNDNSLRYFADVDNFVKMAHGNKMVFKEQIKIIFDGLLNFLDKIENRKRRSVKEWVELPDGIGESCLTNLVSIVGAFQFFKVFLSYKVKYSLSN